MFALTGNVRISDLGLAVELADDQFKIKGYAGTPGTVEATATNTDVQNPQLYNIYLSDCISYLFTLPHVIPLTTLFTDCTAAFTSPTSLTRMTGLKPVGEEVLRYHRNSVQSHSFRSLLINIICIKY